MAKCREIKRNMLWIYSSICSWRFQHFFKISSVLQKRGILTNNCPTVIIPHRESIWTQNYTLAEITGILYKNSQPEPVIGNGRIYENYKRL